MNSHEQTPYDLVGGNQTIEKLVDAFYHRVSHHPDLAPIFPDDLTETARKQKQFLTQFLGGPTLYSDEHGHPMLRARHMPFKITPTRATAWLNCMKEAMDEVELHGPLRDQIFSRLTFTAHHMVNHPDDSE
ncbi:globin [Desertibacillus haloalkaliphilus]|uniref:globin domain-containing protein n=1 Tax=Desertibacillus haloalkaliphilus TaxID=1328930 RepID=UPI001C25B41C|nr:globin [Desertibacillus haloalkaliphilus]MBU8906908.1 globin [Desertibacillus haloalkaliphilus]